MAYLTAGAGAPDILSCQYGTSKLVFRGPQRCLSGRYVAVLGGTNTFGKYVSQPYADHLEQALGLPVVNLGVANAGPDVFLGDEEITRIAQGAQALVVQVMGARNQSNPFYTVHPRRNDRVLGVTPAMRRLFPEMDFTEYHFTRHLMQSLGAVSNDRYTLVVAQLQARWVEQMTALMRGLGPRSVLLWTGSQGPMDNATAQVGPRYPAFVDRSMLGQVASLAHRYVEICPPEERPASDDFMQNLAVETGVLGLRGHRSIAERLEPVLRDIGA
jgi:Domain of unknown function (DUF6473)